MYKSENKKNTETTKRLEQAFKQDRLGGWPSIIGLAGTITFFLHMLFSGWDAYIIIGSVRPYLWELCLFCFTIAVAFVPASLKDARYLSEGKPRPSVQSYGKGIAIRFSITASVIFIFCILLNK